ncbi:MAG: STAS domain-containing protein [Kineosporiaceae bacterium]
MDTTRTDTLDTTVITLSGHVGRLDVAQLRAELVGALDDGEHDVFLDARGLGSFDDLASAALVGARSRAKARRRRLVVLDAADGVLATSLRRTGLLFKLPFYADAEAAASGIGAEREAVRRRTRGVAVPEDAVQEPGAPLGSGPPVRA